MPLKAHCVRDLEGGVTEAAAKTRYARLCTSGAHERKSVNRGSDIGYTPDSMYSDEAWGCHIYVAQEICLVSVCLSGLQPYYNAELWLRTEADHPFTKEDRCVRGIHAL